MNKAPFDETTFWHRPIDDLLSSFRTDPVQGLSSAAAKARLKKYGYNQLKSKKSTSSLRLFCAQFNSPLIYMLLFASGLSLALYEKTDALIIFGIIVVSVCLTFFQERGAVRAMEKLLKIVQIRTNVIRNGSEIEIPIEEVVPGDIVILNAGDVIPGDCSIIESKDLYVDEATLTGETFYTEKKQGLSSADASISKRPNALFMGTHVISGSAKVLVVLTGKITEFGKISGRLAIQPPETEFEKGVRQFGYFLIEVTLFMLIAIFACNVYLERPFIESMLFSLALAVGLTPQLLPAIISINLAYGAKKMADKKVIVKRLASIENFGSMNVLCSDKTGTLTSGLIELDNFRDTEDKESQKVLQYANLNAYFQSGYSNPIDNAIVKRAKMAVADWTKCDEVPYDFVRKRISLLVRKQNESLLISKGAFHQIMDICTKAEIAEGVIVPIDSLSEKLNELFTTYSEQGYRVLGVSYRDGQGIKSLSSADEQEMVFLGFLLFWDLPKENIEATVADLRGLGIELKIITGDNLLVAMQVAKVLGISDQEIITGTDMHAMGDQALGYRVNSTQIFAEIEPNQKERIILALRRSGNVVGYLGDGINDVTALHAADVSISVDSAVDAAKEVADIVLLEKDLSVLQEGVKAGRMTFANTLKYIFMATSANFGNMFSMAGASLFLSFLPLLPKQVLLTNLMTDFPEMTIATDNVDPLMLQKPLRWNIGFIRRFMLIFGLISSIFDYLTFGVLIGLNASVDEFRTGWFTESVISATLIVLVVRTFQPFYRSMPSKYLLSTVILVILATLFFPFTPMGPYLGFKALSGTYYMSIGMLVILYVVAVELAKKWWLSYEKLVLHNKP